MADSLSTLGIPPNPLGGVVQLSAVRGAGLRVVLDEERRNAQLAQAQPLVTSLAAYVRQCWTDARDAKQQTIEERLLQALRQRRNEYDPDKKAQIQAMGGSDLYMSLTSVKCRTAGSWLRDVMLEQGEARPWAIKPTPIPSLPAAVNEAITQQVAAQVQEQEQVTGQQMSQDDVVAMVATARDMALKDAFDKARKAADAMADKMEDQLVEGGFIRALDAFIDDLVTFPSAFLKGPVVRKKPTLSWDGVGPGEAPKVIDQLLLEWDRVSPFDIFPSPSSSNIDDGYIIEKHRLSRADLNALIGVEGYDDGAIKLVLEDYGQGGLREWLVNDMAQADAEGKSGYAVTLNPDAKIDAVQFWGSASGRMLKEWGMDSIDDPSKEYHVEVWLIGSYVIKAVLNPDPLNRKPYYKASYEMVPGSFWGNSVCDLTRDSQTVVNAAGRAIVNNMAMASGPQVAVDVSRLPAGEDLTTITPWRIWQVSSDQYGGGAGKPIDFFQPNSNVAELMGIFTKFSELADEYSGIPRYLQGQTSGGAGRTASGLSMLINNAGKSIKHVISNIDMFVMRPLLERLYFYNMQFADDPVLKGDVQVVAQGAAAVVAKETAQLRRNEFLAATANPVDMQIVGVEGRAAILRETAKGLDMDVDKVVPPVEVLKQRLAAAQQMQMAQEQQAAGGPSASGQQLADGSPVTDNMSPPKGM